MSFRRSRTRGELTQVRIGERERCTEPSTIIVVVISRRESVGCGQGDVRVKTEGLTRTKTISVRDFSDPDS